MSSEVAYRLTALFDVLEAGVREGVAPAMSAVVLTHGTLVHESWHGHAAVVPAAHPLLTSDMFDIASLTKVVCTTTLAAQLVERGDLDLSRSLASILPDAGRFTTVTIRHLLTHTSGLPAWRPYYDAVLNDTTHGPSDSVRRHDTVRSAVLAENLEVAPGQRAVYSDVGFMLLGWAIEALTGEDLATAFGTRIAEPLGLHDTFFVASSPAITTTQAATGTHAGRTFVATERCEHRHEINCGSVNDDNAWALGGVAGHAGLFATASDVARFGQSWLDALYGRPALLREPTATLFAQPDAVEGSTRALGWDTPSPSESSIGSHLGRGRRGAIGHLGYTGTSLWIDIDNEIVCVLLTNRVHPTRENHAIKVFRPRFHDAVALALGIQEQSSRLGSAD